MSDKTKCMYLIVHLVKENFKNVVLMALTEIGARSIQVVDSQYAPQIVAFDDPLFASFRSNYGNKPSYSKMIFSIIDDIDEPIDKFLAAIESAGIDFDGEKIGDIISIPIENSHLLSD